MHYAVLLSVVHLLSQIEVLNAEKPCKVPNGGGGTCLLLSNCPPISQIYNKKHKTQEEILFIHQALCPSNIKPKVCCPAPSDWSQFEAKPVKHPGLNRPIITATKPTPTPAPKPTPKPEPIIIEKEKPLTALPLGRPDTDDENVGERNLLDGDVVSGATFCGEDTASANKITGGSATSVDQYPWLVLLQYQGGGLNCGGSLISSRLVLTAAHCVESLNGRPEFVRLSEYNTTSEPIDKVPVDGGGFEEITVQIIRVENSIKHTGFDRNRLLNDIGLVKLAEEAVFSDFIKTICLPGRDYIPEFNLKTNFTVAGWGEDPNDSRFNDVKKDVSVPYVPFDVCKSRNPSLNDTQICAGGEEGKDTCKGDSGGPLMLEYKQVYIIIGVTSYGPRECGTKGAPAVYTNVYKYLDWIKDALAGKLNL